MKSLTLDFSSAGVWLGVKHFLVGILLAAAIGAVSFGMAWLSHYSVSTHNVEIASLIPFVSEALQGFYKWLTTKQTTSTYPDGTPVA
jgi:hypothetical protein